MGGVVKNSTAPIMDWVEWQKHFPKIEANESYKMWESQASNHIAGIAQELVDKLSGIGVKAGPAGLGLQSAGNFRPYAYQNAIGGLSSYMHVPGFGEVRISDHMRGSGIGNERTFGNSNDAFSAIKNEFAKRLAKQKEQETLKEAVGIVDGMSRKEQIQKLQNWIAEQGYKGKDKDLYPWINKLGM